MTNILFVFALSVLLTISLWWGFKKLPGDNRQILAAIPLCKRDSGTWEGLNLTYYGMLTASAQVFAVSIMLILMGALNRTWTETLFLVVILLGVCVPASRLIARIVEKKTSTFTVGGASFIGMLSAPFILSAANMTGFCTIPVIPFLAAIAISYAFGEGIGRLACISFGCCYGKPLSQCSPLMRRLFSKTCFVFNGKTKKISYESGLDGQEVIPVQALTSIVYLSTGLVAMLFFLGASYAVALIIATCCTQLWRFVSELFRADFRGGGRLSAYQIMSLLLVCYPFAVTVFFPPGRTSVPDIMLGLKGMVNPLLILCLQSIWMIVFFYLGKSKVTGATISFYVRKDRI
ncbi:MAG: prolipoprotein diacylglyceryl transferase [Syntrophorhabdus sp. PtaU1.Bin058]|nr:MAG: prolipoprotein diacylglyceryl transferase [Syntrophorhabdus sp. PtaU1.Bin058]